MRGIMTGCHVPLTEGAVTSMGRGGGGGEGGEGGGEGERGGEGEGGGEGGEGGEVSAGESQDAFIDQLSILWLLH